MLTDPSSIICPPTSQKTLKVYKYHTYLIITKITYIIIRDTQISTLK